MSDDPVAQLKIRLRDDLRTAMHRRAAEEVRVLRTLLGAIDNAQAVPVGRLHGRYVVKAFGDSSAEAPRKQLSCSDLKNVLRRDRLERLQAAAKFEASGKSAEADKLRCEADIVRRYILE